MRTLRPLACALLVVLGALAPAAAQERVLSFLSDVEVERNGDLLVTETIRVQAQGNQIRRGILRDFPTTYTRPDGTRVVVGFAVEAVRRDGAPETYAVESLANGQRIRIGRADQLLANGPHEYVIRYRTTRQIGFFADYDELYWNVTGTGWTFAIDTAEARIRLPERVPFRQRAFYTGPQGARGKDAAVVDDQPGRIVFRTTRPLPPGNGLTVAAAWPKGVVAAPTTAQRADWWLSDNLALVIGGAGLLAVLGFYVFAWLRVGRDPPRGTIIPRFAPPAGMSAAGVRYVDRMAFDNRCFTAAIVELGVNGRLRINGTGTSAVIESRTGGRPVGPAETAALAKLFATRPSLKLDKSNYEPLGKAKDALNNALAHAYAGKLFANNFVWSAFGLLASIVVIAAVVVALAATYGGDQASGAIIGTLIPAFPIMIGAAMLQGGWRRGPHGWWFMLGGALAAASAVAIGLIVMAANGAPVAAMAAGATAWVLAPLSALGFHWLQAPTRAGRAVMDEIEGLREYLGVAEEERLEFLNPPDKTPELFERFLPYAIALDVENTWAKRFAAVLAAAATGAAAGAATSAWYSGNVGNDPVSFADRLGNDLSSTIASASTPPGSDSGGGGSSGGGDSGGGGGGGGGSGW